MTELILVVDDELTLQETIAYQLTRQGYEVVVSADGEDALEKARAHHPDLIILDIMLPKLDGFEVCRILRQEMNTPILMLTARDDEIDRVVGLEVGADDYLTKPFSMRELLARVKALLRRVRLIKEEANVVKEQDSEVLHIGGLVIDLNRHEIRRNNEVINLKPKEYELLICLAKHPGRVYSREMLLEQIWGWEYIGNSRTVDVHIRWLREKIEEDPANPRHLITVRSAGYRFEE
ncbi:MAG TPA: response regulator transcription factor [Anaerolineaceae bacterium]|jgi:DNA-binding response OmpR family regulator|nr:response regulator transcription factor [Anaerolineaceae bacterium]HPC05545.1 response regulator transcription factor [Anaerolineaceae bacterium]